MKLYLRDVRALARTRITQRTITHAYVRVKIYLFCSTAVLPVSSTLNLVTDRIGIVPSSFSSLREDRPKTDNCGYLGFRAEGIAYSVLLTASVQL